MSEEVIKLGNSYINGLESGVKLERERILDLIEKLKIQIIFNNNNQIKVSKNCDVKGISPSLQEGESTEKERISGYSESGTSEEYPSADNIPKETKVKDFQRKSQGNISLNSRELNSEKEKSL